MLAVPETKIGSLPAYAALLNVKRVVPSSTTGYFAVEGHFFYDLMALFLKDVHVDETWYLEKHPDLKEAIVRGAFRSARHHYIRFGYYEHRMPYAIAVEESWYLGAYPDVAEAIHKEVFVSAQEHFETVGYKEGRLPFANFALRTG